MLRDGICGNKPWQRNVNKIIKFNLVGLTVRIADGLIPHRHTYSTHGEARTYSCVVVVSTINQHAAIQR